VNRRDQRLPALGRSPFMAALLGLRSSRARSRMPGMTIGQLVLLFGALATMLITALLSR